MITKTLAYAIATKTIRDHARPAKSPPDFMGTPYSVIMRKEAAIRLAAAVE